MVLELRSGFSRALLELNQIQLGDTELQNQLEETRHGCNKRTLHLETLVLTLKVTYTHTHTHKNFREAEGNLSDVTCSMEVQPCEEDQQGLHQHQSRM